MEMDGGLDPELSASSYLPLAGWTSPTQKESSGRALTRLRFKVFQVYFVLIFIYVLVPAHHHNGKFKLQDKNENSSMNWGRLCGV